VPCGLTLSTRPAQFKCPVCVVGWVARPRSGAVSRFCDDVLARCTLHAALEPPPRSPGCLLPNGRRSRCVVWPSSQKQPGPRSAGVSVSVSVNCRRELGPVLHPSPSQRADMCRPDLTSCHVSFVTLSTTSTGGGIVGLQGYKARTTDSATPHATACHAKLNCSFLPQPATRHVVL